MPFVVIILILLGLWIAFYLVWIAAVLLARIIGIAITVAFVVAGVGFLVGVIVGLIMPIRVLRGQLVNQPKIADPLAVRTGEVFSGGPKGFSANFGWDPAWPLYLPYQLKFDQIAVSTEANRLCRTVHANVRSKCPSPRGLIAKLFVHPLCFVLVGIPTCFIIGGIIFGTLVWLALTWLLAQIGKLVQSITLRSMRTREARFMKREGATVRCTRCYNTFNMPSYGCSNPSCGRVHRDVSPGRLGIYSRICECETKLPLTVARASQSLTAICPFCPGYQELPSGSGSRRVVVVPVFGSVGTGKSSFLSRSAVSLSMIGQDSSTCLGFSALNERADSFLKSSLDEALTGRTPKKTERRETPEGYPFLVTREKSEFELHLMDAAGENFTGSEVSTSLRYLDVAHTLIYLFDPLTIPEVAELLKQSPNSAQFQIAQGSSGDAYGSVADRLRDSGEDLRKRRIAVVVTKADAIASILPGDRLPTHGDEVRDWLFRHGEDRLVSRIEMDFEHVDFFSVSSLGSGPSDSPHHPVKIIDWALTNQGGDSLFAAPATTDPQAGNKKEATL